MVADCEISGFVPAPSSEAMAAQAGKLEIQARQFGNTIHIDVDCLNVVDNVALISGTIAKHTDPAEIGLTPGLAVEDNGEGANASSARRSSSDSRGELQHACSSGLRTGPRPSCRSTTGTSRFANADCG
jgi:hypothetical protein